MSMDFSDMSSYPIVASSDYSPVNETLSYPDTFDKAYLVDGYTNQPDYSLDTFFDFPVSSIEQSIDGLTSTTNQAAVNATFPASKAIQRLSDPAPFGRLDQVSTSGYSFDQLAPESFTSPQDASNASPTPSLCGDGPQLQQQAEDSLSPRSLKRESPDSPTLDSFEPESKRPQRKRGRPRLDRTSTETTTTTSSSTTPTTLKSRHSNRLPHNQVERKYREGLNSELERLRKAVPTLPQSEEGGVMGQPKPSKAMVLAGAIDYIRKLERERDAALEQCERYKTERMGGFNGWGSTGTEEIQFDL